MDILNETQDYVNLIEQYEQDEYAAWTLNENLNSPLVENPDRQPSDAVFQIVRIFLKKNQLTDIECKFDKINSKKTLKYNFYLNSPADIQNFLGFEIIKH